DRSLAEGGTPVTLGAGASLTELEEELHSRIGEFKAEDVKSAPSPVAENGETIGTAILGGGPAGLTAAYILGRRGRPGAVFAAAGPLGVLPVRPPVLANLEKTQ